MRKGRSANRRSRGFSLIELLIVIAIILILVGVGVPMYSKIQMQGRESGALQDLHNIIVAQASYKGIGKVATSLQELCGTGGGSSAAKATLSGNVCSGEDNGYLFTLVATSDYTYTVDARPKTPGSSGRRFFFLDEQGTIHENEKEGQPATASSPPIGGGGGGGGTPAAK